MTNIRHPRGFTLVELLVTMAIFTAVITIAVGALFSAQVINTRLQMTQTILDGMNLATEIIVRDVRYGSYFHCNTTLSEPVPMTRRECAYPSEGTVLIFKPTIPLVGTTDPLRDRVAYYLSGGMLYKKEYPYGGTAVTKQITSSDVNVQKLSFYSTGLYSTSGAPTDNDQPLITIVISGTTIPRKSNTPAVNFNIQTSASSRTLDK